MKKYIYFWVDFDQTFYVSRPIDFASNAQIENIDQLESQPKVNPTNHEILHTFVSTYTLMQRYK